MEKLYGLNCKSLSLLLPQIIAIENKSLSMLSPFITDFAIIPVKNPYSHSSSFLSFLFDNIEAKKLRFFLKTREVSSKVVENQIIGRKNMENVSIVTSEKLHTKALVSSSFYYVGSANLTYSGININEEQCQIGIRGFNENFIDSIIMGE